MTTATQATIDWLLAGAWGTTAQAAPGGGLPGWWPWYCQAFQQDRLAARDPVAAATGGGAMAQCVAHAFAAGYQNALRAQFPSLDGMQWRALLVSETTGKSPKQIHTRLEASANGGWTLNGTKSYVSGGRLAQQLLVLAQAGEQADGRKCMRIASFAADRPGISIQERPSAPVMPEFLHGTAEFSNLELDSDELIPGDGFADHARPFAARESVFLFAAVLSYLFKLATEHSGSPELRERLLGAICMYSALAALDPSTTAAELATQGGHALAAQLLAECDTGLGELPTSVRDAWARDRVILGIGQASAARAIKAWTRLGVQRD